MILGLDLGQCMGRAPAVQRCLAIDLAETRVPEAMSTA
jgi:hypothetical protein